MEVSGVTGTQHHRLAYHTVCPWAFVRGASVRGAFVRAPQRLATVYLTGNPCLALLLLGVH